ncbi:MAG: MoxR family ATPase [Rhodobacter sp.]|nr:MoxR family ATPase [Rhodobacter sp.]
MTAEADIRSRLERVGYVADRGLATAMQLALSLRRPLLLEGEAGVGKTVTAKALADALDTRLIRLQCYEGLDATSTIYEWNYQKQLLAIRVREHDQVTADIIEKRIFSEEYLLRRPLLEAISLERSPVLLIDEVDRADEEFEAYLLEVLSDFQVTIPELGTIEARTRPHVILTSNGTRELSDALRRRCLYSYLEFPDHARELAILRTSMPDLQEALADSIIDFVQQLRREDLEKKPGVAETLDWAAALCGLGIKDLRDAPSKVAATMICLLKTERDLKAVPKETVSRLAGRAA